MHYIFYKIGDKKHFFISNIRGECTIFKSRTDTAGLFDFQNNKRFALTKYVIDDQLIAFLVVGSDSWAAFVIETFAAFDRK